MKGQLLAVILSKKWVDQAYRNDRGSPGLQGVVRHTDKFRILEHLRMIRSGLDKSAWQPQDIDALGDTLCEFEHRFSKYSTDPGHVTV